MDSGQTTIDTPAPDLFLLETEEFQRINENLTDAIQSVRNRTEANIARIRQAAEEQVRAAEDTLRVQIRDLEADANTQQQSVHTAFEQRRKQAAELAAQQASASNYYPAAY